MITTLTAAAAGLASWSLGGVPARAASPALPATALYSVSFTSPENGYGYFIQTAGSRCRGIVARTSDGGARFSDPAVVHSWPCANGVPWQMHLAGNGSGDVFLSGHGLFASHDGGRSWTSVRVPGFALAVSAVGRSVWLLSQACVPKLLPFCHLHMLISSDGGRRWHPPVAQPFRAGLYEWSDAGLVRTGLESGYVVLPPGFDAARGRGLGTAPLLATRNGARSWTRLHIPCDRSMMSVLLAAVPGRSTSLAAVCAGQPGRFRQAKMVAASGNGGRTWTVRKPCPLNLSKGLRCLFDFGYLSQVATPQPGTIFVAGIHVSLDVSRDGGRAWHLVKPSPESAGTDPFEYELRFFSATGGYLLGQDDQAKGPTPAIWHASGGGRTWREVIPVLG